MKKIARCHPEMPHKAKGLCEKCYHKQYNKKLRSSDEGKATQSKYQRKYYDSGGKVIQQKFARGYYKRKSEADPTYKLAHNIRSRFTAALNSNSKVGSAIQDLGCSIDFLKTYLEALFQPGMTWENHGLHGWHIDHIKPLVSFDLTDYEQVKQACHYTNLQPLWAIDNLRKKDKL